MPEGKVLSFKEWAQVNLKVLGDNPYPGRGLIIGLSEDGKQLIQVYWIMGRSANSRNRVFISDDCRSLRTSPSDASKVKDSSLIIYQAMAENSDLYVVSNGDQTDSVIEGDKHCVDFQKTMLTRQYEPDAPNFTPRISAIFSKRLEKPFAEISVLKKTEFGFGCNRFLYRYDEFHPGIGYCVTTYVGDGDPLPSFCGEPYLLPLPGDIDNVAGTIWNSLNEENRVSLAVRFISAGADDSSAMKIVNKYSIVG